jgi:hypothetical protein
MTYAAQHFLTRVVATNKLMSATLALGLWLLGGRAASLAAHKPAENQTVAYKKSVGTITNDEPEHSLVMYPTFKYQSFTDLPTSTLWAQSRLQDPIDSDPARARAYLVVLNGIIHTYNAAAGILAGVGAATAAVTRQFENAAAPQRQAAQGIVPHSTVAPDATIAGQIMLKPLSSGLSTPRLDVPIGGRTVTFTFVKATLRY